MMKKITALLVLVCATFLISNAWAYSDKVVFTGVTQLDGIDVLEGYMKKTGRYDPDIISALNAIAQNAVMSGQEYDTFFARVTVPEDVKLVLSDGTVVGDEVCAGDTISLKTGVARGEFWQDGGDFDTPPVYWVDDVEDTTYEILGEIRRLWLQGAYHPASPDSSGCMDGEVMVDDLSGLPVYKGTDVNSDNPLASCLLASSGVVFCSLNENPSTINGQYYTGGQYTVKDAGVLEVDSTYSLKCAYYAYEYRMTSEMMSDFFDKLGISFPDDLKDAVGECCLIVQAPAIPFYFGEYIHLNLDIDFSNPSDSIDFGPAIEFYNKYQGALDNAKSGNHSYFTLGAFGVNKTIRVVESAAADVELSLPDTDVEFAVENNIRVLVENTGDADISITGVYSNAQHRFISCDRVDLAPGDSSECLLSITPDAARVAAVSVEYEYRSCGVRNSAVDSIPLADSKVIYAESAAQTYGMKVHGDCENTYYACDELSGEEMIAGYKCFKSGSSVSSSFYTESDQRFNLKFDLSKIPADREISSVRLYLTASMVYASQQVDVLGLSDDSWEPVKCVPGGDICTQPYCPECKPLYESSGTKQSGAMVVAPGTYEFDVTEFVKAQLGAGDGIASFQVRSQDGLWESEGSASCNIEGGWEKQHATFTGSGGNRPHLEVILAS